jgi:hypothetical protein
MNLSLFRIWCISLETQYLLLTIVPFVRDLFPSSNLYCNLPSLHTTTIKFNFHILFCTHSFVRSLSFQKLYYGSDDKVYPHLTAVITVNEGVVTGITWDNACVFCSAEECQDNTYGFDGGLATEEEAQQPVGACSISVPECKDSEKAECDLLLYVVWTGTDSNGRDFTSSANRFSAFPKQTWSDRFNLVAPDWFNNLNPFGGDDSTIDQTSN